MTTKRRPTVLIDASDIDRPSGGRTAVLELFRSVFAREPEWRYIVLVSQRETSFSQYHHVHQVVLPHCNRAIERLWIQVLIIYFTMAKGVDIVHFARTIGGIAWPAKNVVTVFDITVLNYPEFHSRAAVWFWRYVQPVFLRSADQIIAISQTVKDDLIHRFSLPSNKIEVVYCAPKSTFQNRVSAQSLKQIRRKYRLPERYILFVGLLAKKKNLLTLIRALHTLKESRANYPSLVIAGRRYQQSDDEAIFQEVRALGLEPDVYYIGPVEDEDLPSLYKGAEVFAFPSLDEGFGIPCLEAMMCQVPVVTTRSGAIPEIVGGAALTVDDPTSADVLAQALHRVLSDPSLREALVAQGIARARQFSWQKPADQMLALYGRLLET